MKADQPEPKEMLRQAAGFYRRGNLAETERLCLEMLAVERDGFAVCHLLGLVRARQGRNAEALALIGDALKINPNSADAWSNYGKVLRAVGRPEDALTSYDKALAIKPDYAEALCNRGNALRDLNRFEEELANYDKALAIKPDYAEALYNRANTLRVLKRLEEALASYDKALAIKPDFAAALNNRANTLRDLRRFDEALMSYDQALALEPDYAEALNNRGNALGCLKRIDEALASYDRALTLKPDYVEALCNRGNTLRAVKRFEEALASYDKVLAIDPDHIETLNNRGVTMFDLERAEEALPSYDRALAVKPDFAEALCNRGLALWSLKRFEAALENYDKALAIKPDFAEALNNRGATLTDLRRPEDALASFDKALAIEPCHARAWNNRGCALRDLKRFDDALASFGKALEIDPASVEALSNRGTMQWFENQNFEAAVLDLERVVAINPEHDYASGNLMHLRMYGGDWRDFERQVALLDAGVRAGKNVAKPFIYQAISDSPADLQICATNFAARNYPSAPVLRTKTKQRHAKIRVGYVSGEFREQATAYLMAGLYESHDRSRFEIVAFDNGWSDDLSTRKRLEAAFGKFIDISRMSDARAAERIAEEEIDILINLNGYFGEQRMGVFARKPAPIQVNYLGFPGTLGADYIDYILADRIVIPESERQYYVEKVVWLPDSYQANDSKRLCVETIPSRAEHGLPATAFVFCNFNQSYKLTPTMFAVWMRILRQVEGSVLWMLESNAKFPENLRREAGRHGVAGERLIFAPHIPAAEHLARMRLGDLFLDSLPCNAHTTASDALWAGLPVLTCRGQAFAGRVAASLLHAVGLPELVSDNLEQYEGLAVKLAAEAELLQSVRKKLERNRLRAPLFDTERFGRHIESAYTKMWEISQRGEPPRSFSVDAAP